MIQGHCLLSYGILNCEVYKYIGNFKRERERQKGHRKQISQLHNAKSNKLQIMFSSNVLVFVFVCMRERITCKLPTGKNNNPKFTVPRCSSSWFNFSSYLVGFWCFFSFVLTQFTWFTCSFAFFSYQSGQRLFTNKHIPHNLIHSRTYLPINIVMKQNKQHVCVCLCVCLQPGAFYCTRHSVQKRHGKRMRALY